ncbi:MAG: glucose 1-dehydrogenase [Micromonosporaceae bacterium]
MRALTVKPGESGSVTVSDVGEPPSDEGEVLVDALAVGICGTDFEIVSGEYGQAPPDSERLILGHESLGRVVEAPPDSTISPGDLVVGMVRAPDPVPCPACAVGEVDMCRNGRYTEHGIDGRQGFARERWRAQPDQLIRLDPGLGDLGVLLEPASVLAKAWEQVERIGTRSSWTPAVVAVTGAGPIGLLAALMGVQRGLDVHIFDRNTSGPKPELARSLGATYHTDRLPDSGLNPDVVMECTGAVPVIVDALRHAANNAITCLTGISSTGKETSLDVGEVNRDIVLRNRVVFGTVSANRRHYEDAVTALAAADPDWLGRLITRRVPLERFQEAFTKQPGDIKVVIEI